MTPPATPTKHTAQPRHLPPVCWLCDRQVYAGARTFVDDQGVERSAHDFCLVRR